MRIALLEASHWHVPLYLDALAGSGVQVVAVSDSDGNAGPAIARRFSASFYESYQTLLEREPVDFAFAFGRHCDMPTIAEALISRGIPFAIEKPCGIRSADVTRLRRLADARGLYVAVPFILRLGDLVREVTADQDDAIHHVNLRFISGPPSRYLASTSPWMLDPAIAGGGALINLGVHGIDLFLRLSREPVRSVRCLTTSRAFGSDIEEFAVLTLATEGGAVGIIEAGYTFPSSASDKRVVSFTMSSDKRFYRSGSDSLEVIARASPDKHEFRPVRLDTDLYYPMFVRHVLADRQLGRPAFAGLAEAEAVMQIVEAAYASARDGGAPCPVRDREAVA